MTTNQKPPTYTGDIAEQHIDPEREYSVENQEIIYSPEQHAIWADLFTGIHQPYLMEHLCQQFKDGLALLDLDPHHIPTVAHLNKRITPRTGWRIERTVVRYTMADDWYNKFSQRIFLITDYLRIFGHLPYLTMEFYARIEDKFAPAYMKATQDEREVIKRLAWYSTEFGLVVEGNRFKIFGAGIISGRAELANAVMEFYRLSRDNVFNYTGHVFEQLNQHFLAHKDDIYRIIDGVNELHQQGQMSSQDQGWNVVHSLYDTLGISRDEYFGGEVILAPFDIETIARIPKTPRCTGPSRGRPDRRR